jgi:uncharacterized protein (TIGR03086 family)
MTERPDFGNATGQLARLLDGITDDQLTALAAAWRDPAAWVGMTQVGGIDLPAEAAATVALNELTVHGWDIARASGQPFDGDPAAVEAAIQFAAAMSAPDQQAGRARIFGPVVDVPADATLLGRLIGLSGRDPGWAPGPG